MTLKLFKIEYRRNHSDRVTTKFIKAYKQTDAVTLGIPHELNGEEQKIDSITVEVLCEMNEILNCTSAAGK